MLSDESLKKKVDKLSKLYPEIGWPDILELTPQIMEVTDAYGIIYDLSGPEKKQKALDVLQGILEKSKYTEGVDEIVPGLIDVIVKASKGGFAINKEQDYDEEISGKSDDSD